MPDIEATLRGLGADLAWPDPPDVAASIGPLLTPRPTRTRRWQLLAAAATLLVALLLAVPGPRQAMADWLGVTGIRIVLGSEPGPPDELGREWRLGRAVPLPAAVEIAGFEPVVPDGLLGPPSEVWARPDEVSLVWLVEGGPAMLTQFEDGDMVKRVLSDRTIVDEVSLDGADAYWIAGVDHVLEDRSGRRLAGNTLIWFVEGRTYRFESGLSRAEAIAVGTEVVGSV